MSLANDLMEHAVALAKSGSSELGLTPPTTADRRRAVSAAYYALFHELSEATVRQMAPKVTEHVANRIHRWLDHTELKRVCREFSAATLRSPLRELIGDAVSPDLRSVASNFIKLQEARHAADYDVSFEVSQRETQELVKLATIALILWRRVADSSEGNIFILSLLLWKQWDRQRA